MITATHIEPSPEFNERCLEVMHRYHDGELPFEDALQKMKSLDAQAKASENPIDRGRVAHLMGNLHLNRGHLNIAIDLLEKARDFYVQGGSPRRMAVIDLNLGEAYRFKGEFGRARKLYRAAYEAARDVHYLTVETAALANEGQLLLTQSDYEGARVALEAALDLTSQWEEDLDQLPGVLAEAHHALAVITLHQGDTSAAWDHAVRAVESAKQGHKREDLGFAYRAIANVMTTLGDSPDPAFASDPDEHYATAIAAFKEVDAEGEVARTLYAQGWSMAGRGRNVMAARLFKQALIIFTRLGMVDDANKAADAQRIVI